MQASDARQMLQGLDAWGCVARLLGPSIMYHSKDVLSPMLKVLFLLRILCCPCLKRHIYSDLLWCCV